MTRPRPATSNLAAFAITLALAAATPVAIADTGDGVFESRGFSMPVASALAFRGKALIDKTDTIVVAISNGDFIADFFANFHDRRRAVQQRMSSPELAIVYLEFKPDGAYRGLSYYFGKNNGCGYCGGGVTSTVKLVQGKLVGTLKMKDESRTMDVKLDVPILSDDHGAPLPAGGGEPGVAYLAYHDALVKRDAKAVRSVMSKENGGYLDSATKKGKADAEMRSMAKEHPEKSVRIVQGWSKGDRAVLVLAGESSVMRLAGEAVLVREGGRWRLDDELMEVVLQ
ncbi:MAG: hypothetical protein ABI585_00710 [Betaproteobacteria bacterium]